MTVRNEEKKAFRDLTPEERGEIVEALSRGDVVDMVIDGMFQPVRMPGAIGMHSIYRTRPRELVIPWEVIRPEYKWAAMDKNLIVYGYTERPHTIGYFSHEYNGHCINLSLALNIDTTGIDWRESLTERPEGV